VIVAADASVLVGELIRKRGRQLISHPALRVFVAEEQWEESLVEAHVLSIVPREIYEDLEEKALARVPRDPRDWPTVAAAIALNAAILTEDADFLGCGCPTWTFQTLSTEIQSQ